MNETTRRLNPGDLPGWIVLSLDEAADALDTLTATMAAIKDPDRYLALIRLVDLLTDKVEGDA